MNLKTNPEHKIFKLKSINKLETKKFFYKFSSLFASLGLATFLSGCSNPLNEQKKIAKELYDQTIEDNKPLMDMYESGSLVNSDINISSFLSCLNVMICPIAFLCLRTVSLSYRIVLI